MEERERVRVWKVPVGGGLSDTVGEGRRNDKLRTKLSQGLGTQVSLIKHH